MTAPTKQLTWTDQLHLLVEQAHAAGEDLAPLLGDGDPNVVDGRTQLYPYRLMLDVYALWGWVEILDEPVSFRLAPAVVGTQVSVLGTLFGHSVELIAITDRITVTRQMVTSAEVLRELATLETKAWARQAATWVEQTGVAS